MHCKSLMDLLFMDGLVQQNKVAWDCYIGRFARFARMFLGQWDC